VIPTQVLTIAGPFRDNRRGSIVVQSDAGDMAEIVITLPPGKDLPGQTTRIVVAGEHLKELRKELGKAVIKPKSVRAVA